MIEAMPRLLLFAPLAMALVAIAPSSADASFSTPRAKAETRRTPDETAKPSIRAWNLAPSPHLTPYQVVEIQLGALGANQAWGNDRGIELAFRFASPGNRSITGPLQRFAGMVKGPRYGALVDHEKASIGPIQVEDEVGQRVMFPIVVQDERGQDHGYVWVLRRQKRGTYRDCWMTEAVFSADLHAVRGSFPGRQQI